MRAFNVACVKSVAAFLIASGAQAQSQEEGLTLMIDQITCREMLKMENESRDFTIIFLHGYMSGKASLIEFDGPELTEATETILDSCISSPDASLLSVFEQVRG